MSATLSCCTPCATVETVNTPGSEGVAGTDGVDGVNAFTITTANIVIPGIGANVGASVESSVWMVVGQILVIGDGVNSVGEDEWAHFRVAAIPDATSVTLTYMGYTGDGGGDGTLLAGCTVSPAGVEGPAGP